MMVHASVHMEFIVSMRGWAIGHGSRNFYLPLLQLPTDLHHHPTSPRLPYQDLGNGNHQIGSLASPGETSHHLSHKNQKIQDSCEKSSSQKQDKWSNHTNLPFSGALRHLQGWLSRQKFFFDASPVRPPGPTPIWPSKARGRSNLHPCRSDSTLTPTLLELITTH